MCSLEHQIDKKMSYRADSENNVITCHNLTLKTCQNKLVSAVIVICHKDDLLT